MYIYRKKKEREKGNKDCLSQNIFKCLVPIYYAQPQNPLNQKK